MALCKPGPSGYEMLVSRVVTGALLIGGVYLLVFHGGGLLFLLVVAATVGLSIRELYALLIPEASRWVKMGGLLLSLGVPVTFHLGRPHISLAILALGSLLLMGLVIALEGPHGVVLRELGIALFGVLYIGLLLSYLVMIRGGAGGAQLVFLVFLTTWAQDVGAFFAGKYLGKRKLCPSISPNKTVEGLVSGFLVATAVAVVSRPVLAPQLGEASRLLLGAGIGLVGPVGDLFESFLKRSVGAKDSGSIFPGHGGFLDRLDSLIFAAPFAYYYIRAAVPGF